MGVPLSKLLVMRRFEYYTFVLLIFMMLVSCNSREQYREQKMKDFSLAMTAEDSVISANVNGLGFAIFKEIASEGNSQSFVLSPFSVASTLAMTTNGASGLALQELEQIIGSSQNTNDFFRKYIKASPHDKENSVILNNLIAVDKNYPLNDSFVNLLQDSYQDCKRD